jgi:nucleoside phosphorylase
MDKPTILLVTNTNVETQAVIDVFEKATKKKRETQQIGNAIQYLLGTIGSTNVFLIQATRGAAGSGSLIIQQAIDNIKPDSAIIIGLAYGIEPSDQKLGDILVASEILSYELQKTDQGNKVLPRSDRLSVSSKLLNIANSVVYDWNISKVHIGPMFSGKKLADSQEFNNELLSLMPEAIGGEMEGGVLYIAADRARLFNAPIIFL